MTDSRLNKVNELCKAEGPILRATTLRSAGFYGKDTEELIQIGLLQRLRRGYYASPEKLNDMDTYEILAALVPDAVISLFSAAQYHDISSIIPQQIDVTFPVNKRVPVLPSDIHVKIHKAIPQVYPAKILIFLQNIKNTPAELVRIFRKIAKIPVNDAVSFDTENYF